MAPRLRAQVAALAVTVSLGLCSPSPSYAAPPTPTPSDSPALSNSPAPSGSPVTTDRPDERLAGRRAGVGRTRPGRTPEPEALGPVAAYVPVAPPTRRPPATPPRTPEPERGTPPPTSLQQAYPRPDMLQIRALPLGTGIALVGLGLGFLAMRLRRR
ncbi:hypothetical protein [Streptomyces sp. NPDC048442]|uniref:hypothetical protein n=1 Tax=Streptomyces sp. NPDC048442 TaxID=3154823 RepID=UPI0034202806